MTYMLVTFLVPSKEGENALDHKEIIERARLEWAAKIDSNRLLEVEKLKIYGESMALAMHRGFKHLLDKELLKENLLVEIK